MPSLLSKLNAKGKEASPQRGNGVVSADTSYDSTLEPNGPSTPDTNLTRSRSRGGGTVSPPKLVLLADDDDESSLDHDDVPLSRSPSSRRNSKRLSRVVLDETALARTVSVESASDKPQRIVNSNGFKGVILSDKEGPSARGSLTLDHLVGSANAVTNSRIDRVAHMTASHSLPNITFSVASPDPNADDPHDPAPHREGSATGQDGTLANSATTGLPSSASTKTITSSATTATAIPASATAPLTDASRTSTDSSSVSALPASPSLSPVVPSPSLSTSVGSGRKSLNLPVDNSSPSRTRRPSRSQPRSGIAGALAASGMALASAHSAPVSSPMTARSLTGASDAESDAGSMESGSGSRQGFPMVPSMEALSMWDVVGTGYALASARRNTEFHQLFPHIPEDDYLVEDYGCALARDILIQGRLYISEHHLCFNANIFGWVTSLAIPFSEIVTIEKRMTALVIPNAIQVATLHARHQFASFLSRDTTYDLLVNIWRIFHPTVPSTAALPDTAPSDVDPDDDVGDHEAPDEEKKEKRRLLLSASKRKRAKSLLAVSVPSSARAANGDAPNTAVVKEPQISPRAISLSHAPTQCACGKTQPAHFSNGVMDANFSTTPEKLYNLMFTSGFLKDFWVDNQKLQDIQLSDWVPGPGGSQNLTRNTQYIKPLSAPVGPKSTKCLVTDETVHVDFDDYTTVSTSTRTPDVPSGNAFEVKTKTCFTWTGAGSSRVLVTTEVLWSKSSFLKSVITNASLAGQKQYHTELEKAMRAYIQQHRSEFIDASQAADGTEATAAAEAEDVVNAAQSSAAAQAAGAAGPTAPLASVTALLPDSARAIVEPLLDVLQDAISGLLSTNLWRTIAITVLTVLAVGNAWGMIRSVGMSPPRRVSTRVHSHHGPQPAADEVASAVRGVLDDYFLQQREWAREQSATAAPIDAKEWRREARELRGELEMLELRMSRLKAYLVDLDD